MKVTPEIKSFLAKTKLTLEQFTGQEPIEGDLDLSSYKTLPQGFNPTVGGNLNLRSLTSIPEGFNPTVGGNLNLRSLTSIPEGFNPTVGGWLDLQSLTSIPKGFNPTVGGWLDLQSLTSIPEGFNPTVGGYLDLRRVTSIPKGFNPSVGISLYLPKGMEVPYTKLPHNHLFSWQEGKYIRVDGVFTEVVAKRAKVWRVKQIASNKVTYLVTDGKGNYAHGETLAEAKADLMYKTADRDKSEFQGLTPETELSLAEAVAAYRVITGACSLGVKGFLASLPQVKKSYSVAEILTLTEGRYGHHEFKEFVV